MRGRISGGTVAAFVAALVVVFLSGVAWAGFTPPPRPDTAVADTADVLTPQQEEALRKRLRALKERTGVSFVVATVPTLDGADIKQASIETFKAWGVGGEENRGLLFTVYVDEAREAGPGAKRCGCIRFEVGRYLEGDVTDTASKRVLKKVGPVVVDGDFDKALNLAVDGVEDILGDAAAGGTTTREGPPEGGGVVAVVLILGGLVFLVIVVVTVSDRRSAPAPYVPPRRAPPYDPGASTRSSTTSDLESFTSFSSSPSSFDSDDDDSGRYMTSHWGDSFGGGSDDSDFFGGGDAGGGGSDW